MQWLKDHLAYAVAAKFVGFAVMAATAFFVPVGARVAILGGGVMLAIGYFWGKLVK